MTLNNFVKYGRAKKQPAEKNGHHDEGEPSTPTDPMIIPYYGGPNDQSRNVVKKAAVFDCCEPVKYRLVEERPRKQPDEGCPNIKSYAFNQEVKQDSDGSSAPSDYQDVFSAFPLHAHKYNEQSRYIKEEAHGPA